MEVWIDDDEKGEVGGWVKGKLWIRVLGRIVLWALNWNEEREEAPRAASMVAQLRSQTTRTRDGTGSLLS